MIVTSGGGSCGEEEEVGENGGLDKDKNGRQTMTQSETLVST